MLKVGDRTPLRRAVTRLFVRDVDGGFWGTNDDESFADWLARADARPLPHRPRPTPARRPRPVPRAS